MNKIWERQSKQQEWIKTTGMFSNIADWEAEDLEFKERPWNGENELNQLWKIKGSHFLPMNLWGLVRITEKSHMLKNYAIQLEGDL
jgi:hypothetical protein